ncbi:hypothetical protein JW872_00470 [Candidatus Babeliales bacterium]|nr:hypothetical protein [Candidatus Babeliales bacterium]
MKRTRFAQVLGGLFLLLSSRMLWAMPAWLNKAFAMWASLALLAVGGQADRRYEDVGREAALAVWACHGVAPEALGESSFVERAMARGWLDDSDDARWAESCAAFQAGLVDRADHTAQEYARYRDSLKYEYKSTGTLGSIRLSSAQLELAGRALVKVFGGQRETRTERHCNSYAQYGGGRTTNCYDRQVHAGLKWEEHEVLRSAGFEHADGTPDKARLRDLRNLHSRLQCGTGGYYAVLDPDAPFAHAMMRALLDDPNSDDMATSWTRR